jgi:hypothetical protein
MTTAHHLVDRVAMAAMRLMGSRKEASTAFACIVGWEVILQIERRR